MVKILYKYSMRNLGACFRQWRGGVWSKEEYTARGVDKTLHGIVKQPLSSAN